MVDPTNMSMFSLLKARLEMLGERQKVIAGNVANVSTPGYVPQDVDTEAFAKTMSAHMRSGSAGDGLATTNAKHISSGGGGTASFSVRPSPDSETTLDGNSVVVEEQMMKIAETRMDFETMVGLYQKSLGLLRMASRSPR